MRSVWVYPFIVLGGVLQTFGAAMNAQLYVSLENRWLASLVSFLVITVFFLCVFVIFPAPLPKLENVAAMPWWAPLGGLVGAVQVYAGLTLVHKVGAGPFVAFTVTAALITSLVVDHFGLLRMPVNAITAGKLVGAALMIAGIVLITRKSG
jgi:transporter family-2 protein